MIVHPLGEFGSLAEQHYMAVQCNTQLLKMIQLGICLTDLDYNVLGCWQFNFRFSLKTDVYSTNVVKDLQTAGVDFDKHAAGIDVETFAELLTASGLVLDPNVIWVSFSSLFDFGFLLRALSGLPLPDRFEDFHALVEAYFPTFYDIKMLLIQSMEASADKKTRETFAALCTYDVLTLAQYCKMNTASMTVRAGHAVIMIRHIFVQMGFDLDFELNMYHGIHS